jgi:hypothetical protein
VRGETYTCAACGEAYEKIRTGVDAMAEAEALFSHAELASKVRVCDDCWEAFMPELPRLRAEADQRAAAAGLSYDEFMRREAVRLDQE